MMSLLATAAASGTVGVIVGFGLSAFASLAADRRLLEAEADRDLANRDAAAMQDAAMLLAIENLRLRGEGTPAATCIPTPWPTDRVVDVQCLAPASGFPIPGPRVPQ